ncbi:MAG: NUDIX domain-containing protein [Candidatus Omnitrophica bacterium]|nr:NUDIX domain-containing protein [Candidatus Omnitrophota bacterium]
MGVVVILPYVGKKVLMQLRDAKAGIVFPGCWGFFGGSMQKGETPEACARRESREELGLHLKRLHKLGISRIPEQGHCTAHSYYCAWGFDRSLEDVQLREGADLGFFSLEDVLSKQLFSTRFKRFYPVADTTYIPTILNLLFHQLEDGRR